MTRLLLLRHGRTRANAEKRFQGRLDLPLDEVGINQAHQARERLQSFDIRHCYCSPLIRARQTAAIALAGRLQPAGELELKLEDRLQEFSLGEWEGWPSHEVMKAVDPALTHWTDIRPLDFKPPGGETLHDVKARVESFLSDLPAPDQGDTLLVGHLVVLSMFRVVLEGADIEQFWKIWQDPGEIVEISREEGA